MPAHHNSTPKKTVTQPIWNGHVIRSLAHAVTQPIWNGHVIRSLAHDKTRMITTTSAPSRSSVSHSVYHKTHAPGRMGNSPSPLISDTSIPSGSDLMD